MSLPQVIISDWQERIATFSTPDQELFPFALVCVLRIQAKGPGVENGIAKPLT